MCARPFPSLLLVSDAQRPATNTDNSHAIPIATAVAGPESMLQFIAACRGLPYKNGADQEVGLEAVRMLDAMYRSAASKKTERAL